MDLGGVLDDFERAHAAVESRDFDALSQGVEMIEKQLSALLERKWGLVSFSSEGEPFDPERHEAIAAEESAEAQDTTVLECYQKGYVLNGRVVRPARVRVRKPAGPPPGA
jgi:molecular chaperone GrpE